MSILLEDAVQLTSDAFEDSTGYFYHTIPHNYNGFIDGMAWVSLLCAASHKRGDMSLAAKCERYLQILIDVGENARNFAPVQVDDDWVRSSTLPHLWYKPEVQDNAGPLALDYALSCGAKISRTKELKDMAESSKFLTNFGWPFGWTVVVVKALRQHINTMFLAYLASGKRPPHSMRWMARENPFFAYICGEFCSVEYPDIVKLNNIKSNTSWTVVPLSRTKPSSWIFRRDPFVEYVGEPSDTKYVPIWMVVGEYLQSTL